jgi:hypothetical protein
VIGIDHIADNTNGKPNGRADEITVSAPRLRVDLEALKRPRLGGKEPTRLSHQSNVSFAPPGLSQFRFFTQGLCPRLRSFAALRLGLGLWKMVAGACQ